MVEMAVKEFHVEGYDALVKLIGESAECKVRKVIFVSPDN